MSRYKFNFADKILRRSFIKNLFSFSAVCCCSLTGVINKLSQHLSIIPSNNNDNLSNDYISTNEQIKKQIETNELDVIIIGAGIAGLSAGFFLGNLNFRILEKNEKAGGRTISGKGRYFSYAMGTEYLGYPEGALKDIVRALKLDPVEIPSPMDAHFDGKNFFYGGEGLAIMHIQNSSVKDVNRFIEDVLEVYEEYEEVTDFESTDDFAWLDEITALEWFEDNEYPDSLIEAYNVASRGLFGANLDEISALSYIPEIAFDFEDEDSIENIDDLENTPNHTGEHSEAYSFLTGITEVTDSLSAHMHHAIIYQATAQSVRKKNGNYVVTYQDSKGKEQILTSKSIILATPAPVASKIASQVLGKEQKEIIDQIDYSVYATVSLFCQKPVFDSAFDLSMPDGYFFTDIYDSTWVQRQLDPSLQDAEEFILTIYVAPYSYRDTSLLSLAEEELLEKIYNDLETIYPDIRKIVTGYDIHRFEFAYPVMTPGAYSRLSRLHEISNHQLHLAGDYMIYPTFEAAADSGKLAAKKLLKSF